MVDRKTGGPEIGDIPEDLREAVGRALPSPERVGSEIISGTAPVDTEDTGAHIPDIDEGGSESVYDESVSYGEPLQFEEDAAMVGDAGDWAEAHDDFEALLDSEDTETSD